MGKVIAWVLVLAGAGLVVINGYAFYDALQTQAGQLLYMNLTMRGVLVLVGAVLAFVGYRRVQAERKSA